jgi:hypothetical protein
MSLDALRMMVDHYPGGRAVLAVRLGKTDEVLRKELSGAPSHKLGLMDAVRISDMCIEARTEHCHAFMNSLAGSCGGFIQLPVVDMESTNLEHKLTEAVREFADVTISTLEANADGVISDNDEKRIRKEIGEVRAALNHLELSVRRKNAAGKLAHLRAA